MQGATILLIEDDDILRSVIKRNLEIRGHRVNVAVDAAQAVQHLRDEHFDLIFLDINLPDQTGWDVLRAARSESGFLQQEVDGKLPVVVLSAVRVSPQRLAEFHPLAYLPKPFPMEAVLRLASEAALRAQATGEQKPYSGEGRFYA
ncbi:MAG: response regulator [Ktedonobacteraceae bacterium]|nr:response regulator [Ktedonobacteraceae bacterium]